jgi:hypothetical protein
MIAKTNIQTQVTAFDFDKLNEKKTDLALMQVLGNDVLVRSNPMAWYQIVKQVVKGWSPKWRSQVDKILPSPEKLNEQMAIMTLQAVKQYLDLKVAESSQLGTQMQVSAEQLMPLVKGLVGSISMPQQEEGK